MKPGSAILKAIHDGTVPPHINRPAPSPVVPTEVLPAPKDDGFTKALVDLTRTFQADSMRRRAEVEFKKGFLSGNAAVTPGSAAAQPWSNMGGTSSALLARAQQSLAASFGRAPQELEAALAQAGLSWGPPFPPGRPLDPFYGYRRPPRTRDYSVGENVQLTPRWGRISFGTLQSLFQSYYAFQIAVRHVINDVRSLDYQFIPPSNVLEDATDDIAKAEAWMRFPDKRQPLRAWVAEYLMDVLRYDAGALYKRRNNVGEVIALEVVSGTTIIPLSDYFGRPPVDEGDADAGPDGLWDSEMTPAFLQIIQGMPWDWLSEADMIYQPLNPMPESQYGLAPMEAVLLQANTDIRFQWHFLQYFTEGTVPAGFMEAPPDLSDPIQVEHWQDTWDAVMYGDQAKLRQIRWVPAGSKFTPMKDAPFDKEFPLYLMRCVCAAFGVTPNDLGFTEDVNRSTGEIQVDVQFRVGTLPVVHHVEDIINTFLAEDLNLRARILFDTGQGSAHRLAQAQADDLDIKNGTISSDERRVRLGHRISKERPTPRIFDNTRSGPIPLLAMESLAGKIDPSTYGPAKDQRLLDAPFIPAPGAAPVIGTTEYKAAMESSANFQRALSTGSDHDMAPGVYQGADGPHSGPQPDALARATHDAKAPKDPAEKEGVMGVGSVGNGGMDNTGGPGVTRGASNPVSLAESGGIGADTGAQGVDLGDDDDDELVEKISAMLKAIDGWRENSLRRLRKGLPPRRFEDLPPFVTEPIWDRLRGANNASEVKAAFSGDMLAPPKAEARKGLNRLVAGIAVQAMDTGRVLMVQRTPDKHDDDDAFARWEWPGGKLDGGEEGGEDPSVWAGALREWAEETGAALPAGAGPCGGWVSDDGEYEGFVVRIAHESDIELDPQPEEVSTASWWDPDDLEDDQVREKIHEQLDDLQPILEKSKKAKWEDFHRHTDKIIEYYAPQVRDALSQVLEADTIHHAMRVAYGDHAEKASMQPTAPGNQNTPKYNNALTALTGVPTTGNVALGAFAGLMGSPAYAVATESLGAMTTALAVLAAVSLLTDPLDKVVAAIWGEAMLQAAREGATAAGGTMGPFDTIPTTDAYWDDWQPGLGGHARQLADGGMAQMLSQAGSVVHGIAETQLRRIGEAIAQGVRDGKPIEETTAAVEAIIHDDAKAREVAETEFSRAATIARRQTYLRNNVAQTQWLHQPGACPRCMENAAVSPISITDLWPQGDAPVHPKCRCVEAPYVGVSFQR